MSIILPEIEVVHTNGHSIRFLEHGWPSELCRWHSHEQYELHLILRTRGTAFVGDHIGEFKAGDLFLTGPNLPHNWVTDEDFSEPVDKRDMLIQFSDENIRTMIKVFPEFNELTEFLNTSSRGLLFEDLDPRVSTHFMEQMRDQTGAERILSFLRFLIVVNRHPKRKALSVAPMKQALLSSKQLKVARVVDYVSQHYADKLSVGQAAEMTCMSEASFSRNFQRVTGNRFVEFVNRVRVGHACTKLFETNDPISSICHDVGFQNIANFNRHFQKMKNMTPREFRHTSRSQLGPSPTQESSSA